MRKIVLLAALLVVCPTLALAAPSAQKKALIDELMRVSNAHALGASFLVEMMLMAMPQKPDEKELEDMRGKAAADPASRKLIEQAFVDIYDRNFTDAQLRELVAFFKSDLGKKYAQTQLLLASEGRGELAGAVNQTLGGAIARSKARRTMADLRTLAVCAEAYATDYNAYPDAESIDELEPIIKPVYIRTVPKLDAWSKPYAYITNANKDAYRFISGGPDGQIDPASRKIGAPASKTSDDIVFENGEFVQTPAGLNQ